MTIKLYTTTDPKNKLNKTLTPVETLTGTLKNNTDLINPVVDIEYSSFNFNYVYIQEFNRYYFITSLKSMSNDLIRMELHVDVLMTYQSRIITTTQYIERQQNSNEKYLTDPAVPFNAGYSRNIIPFPYTPFDFKTESGDHYVLTVLGGEN